MAMKDWKRLGKNRWENKKTKDLLKIGGDESNGKYGYDVKLGEYNDYLIRMREIGNFKTKSQALAYAIAYMKTH